MDYVFPSNKETNNENLDSNHEQEAALFGQFPNLPFLDDQISTSALQNHHRTATSSPANNDPPPPPPPTKRPRKKRSAGKKDRHSKIHTAQGLRDRRMRLSLHIARKFFGLQDMLGFDKASKTIEWLFSKSKKAIEEVMELGLKSQNTVITHDQSVSNENIERCQSPLSDCVVDSDIEFNAAAYSNKGKQLIKLKDEIARESREKARARARERTRERMMMVNNDLEKSKQMSEANPNDHDFDHQLQLGFSVNPDHNSNYIKESCYFSGFGYDKSFANPPAGWLNSSNTFLGFLGGWDSENYIRLESENYGILPNASSTGDDHHIHEQSLSSVIFPHANFLQFQGD